MIVAILQNVPRTRSDTMDRVDFDRLAGTIGVVSTGVFCFFLAFLILDTRRGKPADRALSAVVFVWGFICAIAFWRYTQGIFLVPYLTPLTWLLATILEIVATVLIIQERRENAKVERMESLMTRQEQLTERQEVVTQQLEDHVKKES